MNKLHTINAEDLQNRTYEPTHFLVDELIPEGLHILAGAPKIGKSWLALWLCLCVAQGQPLWNFATTQGEVLYLSLEDSFQRIQTRLFDLTEDAPPTLHFAIMANTLKHGLEQQIEQFLTEHPTTKLVVIDTLQRVRSAGSDSNLYADMKTLLTKQEAQKSLAAMQASATEFAEQAGSLSTRYSSTCKELTDSTQKAVTTILESSNREISAVAQESKKKIRLCAWVSITAVILCAALCALAVLWSR